MNLSPKIRDVCVAALVATALYASGLLVIFTPLPFLYVTVIHGRRAGVFLACLCAAIALAGYAIVFHFTGEGWVRHIPIPGIGLGVFLSPAFLTFAGVLYFVFFMAVGFVLGWGVGRRLSLARMGAHALIAGLAVLAVIVIGAGFFEAQGIAGGVKNYLQEVVSGIVAANGSASGGSELDYLKENAGEIVSFMLGIIPSLIFVFALLAVVVNLLVGRRIIRAHRAFSHVHNVARFRLPDALVWMVVASGTAFFADRYALRAGIVEIVAINCLIGLGALYFFQGLAVVVYFLQGIRIPLLRSIAYLSIILFFQSTGVMIVGIGVADVWADFRLRRWRAKRVKE